jgi:hypothetical protein
LFKMLLPLSPIIAFIVDVIDNKKADKQWIPEFKGLIDQDLIASLKEDEILELSKLIIKYAARDGKLITPESYELIFANNFGELYNLIWQVIKSNFSSALSMFKKKV